MKLDLSDEQTLLRDSLARLFRDESPAERVRAAEPTNGFDRELWRQLVDLGAPLMRAPAAAGGAGLGLFEAALAAEEAGRRVAAAPVVEAIVASALLLTLQPAGELRDQAMAGAVVTLALQPVEPGRPQVVPAGAVADIILARRGEAVIAFARIPARQAARNIAAAPLALLDLADLAEGAVTLASGPQACDAYDAAIEEWRLLTASSLVGLSRQALELAAAYSAERIQFGKPIGSFQGVAHPLADSATECDGAKLLVWKAISAIAQGGADAAAMVSAACWWAAETSERATKRALRAFGGYGLSLEYDVQLYYRRAKLLGLLAGSPARDLDRLAERLWDGVQPSLPTASEPGVDFGFGDKAEAFAQEVRAFVEASMTPEVAAARHHSTDGFHPGFHRQLAAAGYLFPDMALNGSPARDRYEVAAALPVWEDLNWTHTPMGLAEFILKMTALWGSEAAKAEIMPRIIEGDALGCLGFSEPGSGSDVFAAQLRAVRDGDDWVVNGQKMFTTGAHKADYILLLTRTDPTLKKHQGLTMFVAPMKQAGVEIQPVRTLQDERTNIVYFQDVRVPDRYRLGEAGEGARVMASALQFEHGGWEYHAAQTMMLKHALAWAKRDGRDGPPIRSAEARRVLARAWVNCLVADVLCRRQIWGEAEQRHDPTWGPMAKLFTTEATAADAAAIVALAAPESLLRGRDHDLDMVETTMRRALAMTVYGGTSEVHRSIIAEKSLGMPNSRS